MSSSGGARRGLERAPKRFIEQARACTIAEHTEGTVQIRRFAVISTEQNDTGFGLHLSRLWKRDTNLGNAKVLDVLVCVAWRRLDAVSQKEVGVLTLRRLLNLALQRRLS
uniref:Uncharacterized protein n=1 Tax=Trichuris muris TaxID=70415 RepID=A0A5S6R1C2_TRIMR